MKNYIIIHVESCYSEILSVEIKKNLTKQYADGFIEGLIAMSDFDMAFSSKQDKSYHGGKVFEFSRDDTLDHLTVHHYISTNIGSKFAKMVTEKLKQHLSKENGGK